jgi:hypothetical protein
MLSPSFPVTMRYLASTITFNDNVAIQTAEHDLDLHSTSTGTAKRDDRWQLKSQEGRSRLLVA